MRQVGETTRESTDSTNRRRGSHFSVRPSSLPPGTDQDVYQGWMQNALFCIGSWFRVPYILKCAPCDKPQPGFRSGAFPVPHEGTSPASREIHFPRAFPLSRLAARASSFFSSERPAPRQPYAEV